MRGKTQDRGNSGKDRERPEEVMHKNSEDVGPGREKKPI